MTEFRQETDSMGAMNVPADKYWGAQTARSLKNFDIGTEVFCPEFIRALAIVKKASAKANKCFNKLPKEKFQLITQAAEEVMDGRFNDQFPLSIWQTGSGTQTNMNMNEVIANRAIEIAGGRKGSKEPIHPNDDVNMSQSSNDVIPTAMHISCSTMIHKSLVPGLDALKRTLEKKSAEFYQINKIGRTHLMDATPISLKQVFDSFSKQIEDQMQNLKHATHGLDHLPVGGTAVGTGFNTPSGEYATEVVNDISKICGYTYHPAPNKSIGIASHDAIVALSGVCKTIAVALMKIANDIRWMASGPRCGIAELILPANEPGSSIMPGKVNPTQCEALTMVCAQVMGNDTTINIAGASGNFELNVYKPVMIYNILQSIRLLSDSINRFNKNCVLGIQVNTAEVDEHLKNSLMLVTALNAHLGYDQAARIAKKAYEEKTTLKEAALALGLIDAQTFDRVVDPCKMLGPQQ
ncbi:MAG: class II fumarate hydratase [Candidatus Omnitrophica bacterium]|nr:class II fumarate hydratase [Candidatus Omnitrophota bacterium]